MASVNREEKDNSKKRFTKSGFRNLRKIFEYPLAYRRDFLIGLLFLIFSSLSMMAFPFLSGQLIDLANGKETEYFSTIGQAMIFFGVVLVAQAIFSFFRVILFARVSEQSMATLRKDLFSSLMLLPIPFYDQQRSGDLLSRITSDVGMLQNTFSVTLAELIRQVLTLVIGTIFIFFMAAKLSAFMLVTFPLLVVAALVFGRFIRKLSRKTQDLLASANTVAEEAIAGIRIVKAFTNEWLETKKYRESQDKVVKVAIRSAVYRGLFISFVIVAMFGGIVLVLWYGTRLVQSGELSTGSLISFIIYTAFIGGSVAGLGDIFGQIQRAIGASERVIELLDEKKEDMTSRHELRLRGHIHFDQVSFSYPTRPDVPVLENIDLEIKAGTCVALVGHSGAGKSTIAQLLLRQYAPQEGIIWMDDKSIEAYDLYDYRSNFGVVPQEITLFGGTIRENIGYGNPSATDEDIMEAALKANAIEFIEHFPEGLDTIVGDRGVKLSGGQRQRIAIARAILKDPAVLILDEATSSLDAQSESLVQEALDRLMQGRTTIIIAHRLATIRKADNIIVLQAGKIVETGRHEELVKDKSSMYSNLVRLQLNNG